MPLNFSNAYRWTRCAAAGQDFPAGTGYGIGAELSAPRKEGRAAAWIADGVLRGDASCAADYLGELSPDGWTVTPDMVDHVQRYIDHVSSFGAVQSEASMSWYGITGRVDQHCATVGDTLRIFELKYGFRIVEPEENEQLLLAAITLLKGHHRDVELTVFQPRPFHPSGPVRTWNITPSVLMRWADYFRMKADGALLFGGQCLDGKQAPLSAADGQTLYATAILPNDNVDYRDIHCRTAGCRPLSLRTAFVALTRCVLSSTALT
jgi:hypothetical protein